MKKKDHTKALFKYDSTSTKVMFYVLKCDFQVQ